MGNTNKKIWKMITLVFIAVIAAFILTGCTRQQTVTVPSEMPLATSTAVPTIAPTAIPTITPTAIPTITPTAAPTATPEVFIIEEPVPEPETAPEVVNVQADGFNLTYTNLYADTVACIELKDTAEVDFEFTVTINENVYTIFKAVVGAENGDIVSMLNRTDGTKVPVSFYMNVLPEGLEGDDASAFYIAQDVVNEVMDTLKIL